MLLWKTIAFKLSSRCSSLHLKREYWWLLVTFDSLDQFLKFVKYMNNKYHNINFTFQHEQNNIFHFLMSKYATRIKILLFHYTLKIWYFRVSPVLKTWPHTKFFEKTVRKHFIYVIHWKSNMTKTLFSKAVNCKSFLNK